MTIIQLECFIAVAKNQSYTDAAIALSISQSSVSKHILKLEKEIGARLIDRHTRKVSLTLQGETFLEHALNMMTEYYTALRRISCFSETCTLRLGSVDHLRKVGLTKPIANFLASYPNIHIALEQSDTRCLLDMLLQCKIDLALIAHIYCDMPNLSNIKEYALEDYMQFTMVKDYYDLAVHLEHPLAIQQKVTWEQLSQERLMILDSTFSSNILIKRMLSKQHLQVEIAFEAKQVDTLVGLLNENYGVALLSRRVIEAHPNIKSIPIVNPIHRDTVLVSPRQSLQHKICQNFIDSMMHHIDECE